MIGTGRRWLFLSLALNALLLGAVLGGGWMLTRAPVAPAATRLRDAGEGLGEAERTRFLAVLRETRVANRPLVRAARQARGRAAAALVAEPFDPAALGDALDRARLADLTLRRAREAAIVRFAATLSPADRAALAAGLRTTMLRGGPGGARSVGGAGR